MIAVSATYRHDVELFSIDGLGNPVYASRIAQGTPPADGGFNGAWSVAYDLNGNLYATDWFNHRVEKFDPNGGYLLQFGFYGSQASNLEFPRGVAVSADGSTVAVAQENNNIAFFDSSGAFKSAAWPAGGLHRPRQVSFDPR